MEMETSAGAREGVNSQSASVGRDKAKLRYQLPRRPEWYASEGATTCRWEEESSRKNALFATGGGGRNSHQADGEGRCPS